MATKEWPELLGQLHEAMCEVLTVAGVSGEKMETYALEGCKIVQHRVFGGGAVQVYVPSEHTTEIRIRNREILKKSRRMSIKQLCAEYPSLSETRIRHILNPPPSAFHRKPKPPKPKRKTAQKINALQPTLF